MAHCEPAGAKRSNSYPVPANTVSATSELPQFSRTRLRLASGAGFQDLRPMIWDFLELLLLLFSLLQICPFAWNSLIITLHWLTESWQQRNILSYCLVPCIGRLA